MASAPRRRKGAQVDLGVAKTETPGNQTQASRGKGRSKNTSSSAENRNGLSRRRTNGTNPADSSSMSILNKRRNHVMLATVTVLSTVWVFLLRKGKDSLARPKNRPSTPTRDPRDIIASIYVGERYQVLQTLPHDPKAFTQGLTFYGGKLYEGTGLYGQSDLREVDISSSSGEEGAWGTVGQAMRSVNMDAKYFGEGIAHFIDDSGDQRIIQITWKEQTGFIYDAQTFEIIREFPYQTVTNEGWGITYDDRKKEFVVSDGSDWLFFWDRDTLEEKRRVQVKLPQLKEVADEEGGTRKEIAWNRPLKYINELEMVDGFVIANVWYQNVLVVINPEDGSVLKVYDFRNLYTNRSPQADCFNGISVTEKKDELFVTGKQWPSLYRIRLSLDD